MIENHNKQIIEFSYKTQFLESEIQSKNEIIAHLNLNHSNIMEEINEIKNNTLNDLTIKEKKIQELETLVQENLNIFQSYKAEKEKDIKEVHIKLEDMRKAKDIEFSEMKENLNIILLQKNENEQSLNLTKESLASALLKEKELL